MSQVKVQWVLERDLFESKDRIFDYQEHDNIAAPVIPLSALADVVEGLRALDRMCAAHKIQDVDAHAVIYKLLAQLEAYRKEGA